MTKEPTIIDTITVESENAPIELKVATNLKPVEGTANMYTIPDSPEPAVERNPMKGFAFIASEAVADFIVEHSETKAHNGEGLISEIISDSHEFRLWLEKHHPDASKIHEALCTAKELYKRLSEAPEEWYPGPDDDDRVWELQTELAYARRELRHSERDRNGWRRMALINFIGFAIYVAVDVAARFLNN